MKLTLHVETERESSKRWIADVVDLPGVMAYGATEAHAIRAAQALALEVVADRIKHGENVKTGARSSGRRGSAFGGLTFAV